MKKFLFICLLSATTISLFARGFESISLGANVGYTNHSIIGGEIFLQGGGQLWERPVNAKVGVSYFPYQASFRQRTDLHTESIGIFAEGVIHPFSNFLFAGFRWEGINFNWFSQESLQAIGSDMSFVLFSGTGFYGVVGASIPLSNNISLNLSAMPGFQNYRLADGLFSSGNFTTGGMHQENHILFNFRALAGISIRLR